MSNIEELMRAQEAKINELRAELNETRAANGKLAVLALQGGAGHDAIVKKAAELQAKIETLRKITNIKDPEQHFEQIMSACKAKSKKIVQLQTELTKLKAKEINGDILFKWLKKAYEMGVKRDRFSAEQSESDLPALDLNYVPKMQTELKQALKE